MTELPLGWLEAPLSEIIQPRGEKVQPSALPNKPFIGMDHVEAHTTRILGSVPASTMKSAAARFYEGDVLYGRLRPYLNKVAHPRFDGLASAEFIVFPSTPLVDSAWLQLRLNASDFVNFASHLNEGDRPRVDFDQIGVFDIRVPPINEQRRIVEKIETLFADLDAGVVSLTRARARLALYRQSVLKAAFEGRLTADWRAQNPDKLEDPDTLLARIQDERATRYKQAIDDWQEVLEEWRANGEKGKKPTKPKRFPDPTGEVDFPEDVHPPKPHEWLWLSVGDLAEVTGGLTKNQKRNALPKKARYLRVANVYANRFDLGEVHEIGLSEDEARKTFLKSGDLLIVEGNGSVEQIGRMALWREQLQHVSHQNHLIRARFLSPIDPLFALMFFMSPWGRKLVVKKASSTSGLHTLSISKVSALPCPVPHIDEQREIVKRLEAELSNIDALEAQIEDGLARSKALRQSILKRAFAGQLVAQDPNDEPAHVLLERIKAEKAAVPKAKRRRKANA